MVRRSITSFCAAAALIVGCDSGKIGLGDSGGGGTGGETTSGDGTVPDGLGTEPDSRLIADVITWPCWDPERDNYYLGAYALTATLEYAPDRLQGLELPGPGECVRGVSMFPEDAGNDGADLDVAEGGPVWVTSWGETGPMERRAAGFYYGDIFGTQHSCQPTDDLLTEGLSVDSAGALTGASTPGAGTLDEVVISDELGTSGLSFGDELSLSWTAAGWQTSWVQIRMERDGFAYDSVICNTTDTDSFTIDAAVWDLLDGEMAIEVINLYVGFQNDEELELETGLKVQAITRAMYVGVIQD